MRAKYRLLHTVRTNTCFDDYAHSCIRKVDADGGQTALSIDKTAIEIGGVAAISANLRRLAPLVLPLPLLVNPSFYVGFRVFATVTPPLRSAAWPQCMPVIGGSHCW